jgi:hypothetical protein
MGMSGADPQRAPAGAARPVRLGLAIPAIAAVILIGAFLEWKWYAPIKNSQIVGTYRCAYPYGSEVLTLAADGTYSKQFSFNSGKVINNNGTWKLKNSRLYLNNAIVVDDGAGQPRAIEPQGLWILIVSRSWSGKPFITVNEEMGLRFQID